MLLPQGKGMYLWNYQAPVATIVAECKAAGLLHLLIKIADGTTEFGTSYDKRALIAALRAEGIDVWGWHYIYLAYPDSEAALALRLMGELDLTGYVIDAERECKGRATQATRFMHGFASAFFPIGLSSYRYPSLHPELPWREFRNECDFDMPQVYWLFAHNPVEQLHRCYDEFKKLTPALPFIPTGCAWKQTDPSTKLPWSPTPAELTAFMDEAKEMGFTGVNFWEFNKTRAIPELWEAIKAYQWETVTPPPPPTNIEARLAALESYAITDGAISSQIVIDIASLKQSHNNVVDDLEALNNRIDAIAARLAALEARPPATISAPFKMNEKKPAMCMDGQNAVGKPKFHIYPSESKDDQGKRVFLEGTIQVCPIPVVGDSGVKAYPVYKAGAPVQLYVFVEDGKLV